MGKQPTRVAKAAVLGWRRLADISTAAWLWSLVPSGIASVIAGWLAYGEGLPKSVVLLIALATIAVAMFILAFWRAWRDSAAPQEQRQISPSFDDYFREESARRKAAGLARAIHGGDPEPLTQPRFKQPPFFEAISRRSIPTIGPQQPPVEDMIAAASGDLQQRIDEAQDGYSEEFDWYAAKREGRTKIVRDKSLGEALAYSGLGHWGKQFVDAAAHGIGAANVPLKKFEQLAYDGRLHVWGKSDQHSDFYEEIPREHWKKNQVEWFDLLRGMPRTEPRGQTGDPPYYDLMVSRAEFEEAMPYVRQPD